MPDRAGEWKAKQLSFNDRPEDQYTIQYRDPIKALESLFQDPNNAKHLVYAPKKIYADETKKNRIFNEMWTGQWWHVLQVNYINTLFL
jgi:Plavaka transposase